MMAIIQEYWKCGGDRIVQKGVTPSISSSRKILDFQRGSTSCSLASNEEVRARDSAMVKEEVISKVFWLLQAHGSGSGCVGQFKQVGLIACPNPINATDQEKRRLSIRRRPSGAMDALWVEKKQSTVFPFDQARLSP